MQDERFHLPTRDELVAALDKLLETPRAVSDGGWADVSFDRMHELDGFFRLVRKSVMEPDPDGDMVITWSMLHPKYHKSPADGVRVPHEFDTPEKLQEAAVAATNLVNVGADILRLVNFQMSENIRDAKNAAAVKE